MIHYSEGLGTIVRNCELRAENKQLNAEVQTLKTRIELLKAENHNLLGASHNPRDKMEIRELQADRSKLMNINHDLQWKLDTKCRGTEHHYYYSSSTGSFVTALACVISGFYLGVTSI